MIAYWSAISAGGRLVLRLEDIDSPRVKSWATNQAIEDLTWLGIRWTGPPTIQTDRIEHYTGLLDQLRRDDQIYPCTCTRQDIEQSGSAPHFEHELPVYAGTCSDWRYGDALPDLPFAWRFRTSEIRGQPTQDVDFDDKVAGPQSANVAEQLGDFPVTQKSGGPSYQLAVVVDDVDAGVTEVVRGNDLIISTFRQCLIYRYLNVSPPKYAHVPLVLGVDGRRLAKRHGDTRLSTLRESGIDPMQIVTWAARSSGFWHSAEPVRHIDDVLPHFHWSGMSRLNAVISNDSVAQFNQSH